MEYCSDRHNLIYKIRYKSSNLGGSQTEWLVCEQCFNDKEVFGDEDAIDSITMIKSGRILKVDLEKISILTRKLIMKIKMLVTKH